MCILHRKKDEGIHMLTEIIVEGQENFPAITELLTDQIAWYIGDFFKDEEVMISNISGKSNNHRLILLPENSETIVLHGGLMIAVGVKVLKVLW